MFASLLIAVAVLVAPAGDFVGPNGLSEPVVCDSSTVPVQTGSEVVCVAPSAIIGSPQQYSPLLGVGSGFYPESLAPWYGNSIPVGFGFGSQFGHGLFGGSLFRHGGLFGGGLFGHGFGHGFHCTTDATTGVRTCVN